MRKVATGVVSLMLAALVPAVSAADLAQWTFEVSVPTTAGPHTAEGGVFASISYASGWHLDPNVVYSNPVGNGSNESFSSNFWTAGDYYQFQTRTLGFQGITFTWHQTRSSTGPGTFDLEWSLDGTNWNVLVNDQAIGAVTWSSGTPQSGSIFGPIAAPAALNNQTVVYFRLRSEVTPTNTAGTSRVDNIVVAGESLGGTGACCFGTTCVEDLTADDCLWQEGVYQGDGSTCTPNPCLIGACCVGETCTIETQPYCVTTLGGTYKGDLTTCTPNPCLSCLPGGIPFARTLPTGQEVKLCNVVVSSTVDTVPGTTSAAFHVQHQDNSGGITIFGTTTNINAVLAYPLFVGDKINITGTLTQYNGLLELTVGPFTTPPVEFLNTGNTITPVTITSDDVTIGSPTAEQYESMFVRLNCVSFADQGVFADSLYYATDPTGLIRVRCSPGTNLVNTPIPTGQVDIVGILTQNDSTSPYTAGYEILLNEPNNITPSSGCGPAIGTCCIYSTCSMTTAAACTTAGGVYLGNGTWCNDIICNRPVQNGDLALGLSGPNYNQNAYHIRGGAQVASWANPSRPYLQSMEFDNAAGLLHNARGNLLALNYGAANENGQAPNCTDYATRPQEGGKLYNVATDGSNNGELLYEFNTGAASPGIACTRVTGLSVSPNNQFLAVWGWDTARLYVLRYDAGAVPGSGIGAAITQAWSYNPVGNTSSSQATTWLDNSTVLVANYIGASQIALRAVTVDPNSGPVSHATVATIGFAAAGQFVDVEYNPNVDPDHVFVMASFTGSSTLAILNRTTWLEEKRVTFNTSSNTSREIALGPDHYLYWSEYHSGSSGPAVERLDVSNIAALTDDSSENYFSHDVYSAYNGLDVGFSYALTGACCYGPACSIEAEADCVGTSGIYQGDGTSCVPNPCLTCSTVADAKLAGPYVDVLLCQVVVSSKTDLINDPNQTTFHLQDADGGAGITVYGGNAVLDPILAQINVGDRITIQGTTGYSSGLFELNAYLGPLVLLQNHGSFGVSPQTVEAADFADGSPTAEGLESLLVTVPCVHFNQTGTFAYGNYTATDSTGTLTVRIATQYLDLVGQPIPTGDVNLTGIFSQYAGAPYTTGYQLLLRSVADITPANCGACRGDCNCDGTVGFADIDLFVAGIPNNQANWAAKYLQYYGTQPPAGCWENTNVNATGTHCGFDDIDPFVKLIPTPCTPRACCFPDHSCQDLVPGDCLIAGGTFSKTSANLCAQTTCP